MPGQRAIRGMRKPRTTRGGSLMAKGTTFAELTRHPGTAFVSPDLRTAILGMHFQKKFNRYDTLAQGWIARALADPFIARKANGKTAGTGSELCVCGYFLSHGYRTNRDLFFQSYRIIINDRSRTRITKQFVVDIAINNRFGGQVFLNIDGAEFHTRTELEAFRDLARDGTQKKKGRPVDVPDQVCYRGEDLIAFLERKGISQ